MMRMSTSFFLALILASAPSLAVDAPKQSADPRHEGDWYVSDTTDNNTGEREVYAFTHYLKGDDPDYVTLTMRCVDDAPVVSVEWANLTFPFQTVIAFGPIASPDSEPEEEPYMFEKSTGSINRGLIATPAISRRIIAALGQVKHTMISAHISAQPRFVMMNVDGAQQAWNRVARHCPAPIMPRPPQ